MNNRDAYTMAGFKRLAEPELQEFLDDITTNIDTAPDAHFVKIIKYLIFIINAQLYDPQINISLCAKVISAIELLLHKRKLLLTIELSPDLVQSITPGYDVFQQLGLEPSGYVFEVLIYTQLHNLANIPSLDSTATNMIKEFVMLVFKISVTSLTELRTKKYLKTRVRTNMARLIDEIFANLNNPLVYKVVVTVNMLLVINEYEIYQKLMINQFEFNLWLKKAWIVVNSLNHEVLKSVMILNLANHITLNNSIKFPSITLLIEWILACLNSPSLLSEKVLVNSICKSLLKLLKFSADKQIHFNIKTLINAPHYLESNLPLVVRQVLLVFEKYDTNFLGFPNLKNSELNQLVDQLFRLDKLSLLNYLDYESYDFSSVQDFYNEKCLSAWLNNVIRLMKTPNPELNILANESLFYTVLTALGNIPCLVTQQFNFELMECEMCGTHPTVKNHYTNISPKRPKINENELVSVYYNQVILLIIDTKSDLLVNNPLICCNFLLCIYKLLASFQFTEDLNTNAVFSLIKTLLVNSNRDVRILCSRILPLLLLCEKDITLEKNFSLVFQHLSSIEFTSSADTHLAETTIKAFTEIAIISEGDWLNALMLRFIDLLGAQNELHINLACNSLVIIANFKNLKPYRLLSLYLPVVAVKLIKTPQLLNKLLEVVEVTREFFLKSTKDYTTPHLLDYYKYDYIQDISNACGMTREKLISRCSAKILAIYFCKDDQINEKYISNILKNAGYYKPIKFSDLLFSSGIGSVTWYILLQINYGEAPGTMKNQAKIYNALEYVSKMTYNSTRSYTRTKKSSLDQLDYIRILLEDNILEIIQSISSCIYQNNTPFFEKILAVKAIEFLINHNISATTSVLSQICTSLQSLIVVPEFEYVTITCLNLLIKNLNINNLISLFDIVISLIFQRFGFFEPRSKLVAVDIIKKLFNDLKHLPASYSLYYFSVPFIPNLIQDYKLDSSSRNFKNIIKPKLKTGYLPEFTRRLKTLNKFVVKQALIDLINFTNQYQEVCQTEFSKDTNGSQLTAVSELINILLDTSYKFKVETENDEISVYCAKALSSIGALDPNKFNLKTIRSTITLVHNFNDYKENAALLADFLQNIIIINFWASNNPIRQMHYSYAMQEFLKVLKLSQNAKALVELGLNTSQTRRGALQIPEPYLRIWESFSDVAKSTLTPFLQSSFVFSSGGKYQKPEYPLFKLGMSHDDWIILLAKDLIKRPIPAGGDEETKKALFDAFNAIIRQNDISVCNYLLKYLVLTHMLSSDGDFVECFLVEITEIYSFDLAQINSADYVETVKLCYQTIFEVLDYLNQWKSLTTQFLNEDTTDVTRIETKLIKKDLESINKFLNQISSYSLIDKAAKCGSYERTILYFEENFRDGSIDSNFIIENIDKDISLHLMYSNINDLDALDGVLKNFSTRNTNIQLKSFQYNENWSIAQEAFHVLGEQNHDNKINEYKTKFLKSLNDHASYDEVISNLSSIVDANELLEFPLEWAMVGLQASILSGSPDNLRKWLYVTDSIEPPQDVDNLIVYKLANGLALARQGLALDRQGQGVVPLAGVSGSGLASVGAPVPSTIEDIYKIIGSSLTSSLSSVSKNINLMMQLHMIFDISLLLNSDATNNILNLRLANIDQSFEPKWKLLSIHRVANIIRGNDQEINKNLLACSELARENNKYDISIINIMKAMNYNFTNAELNMEIETNFEYAQLSWLQGKQTDAIKILETINSNMISSDNSQRAKIQLQYAEWLNESNHSSSDTIIEQYMKAFSLEKSWEKPYYLLGKYYDKLLESSNSSNGVYQQQIIKLFLKALILGPTYIFEALPKFITIWLDFAQDTTLSGDALRRLTSIVRDIKEHARDVPNYVWYTSITQMLSRISHAHKPSVALLQDIIKRVIEFYPRQALWFTLSHTSSKDKFRRDKVGEIVHSFGSSSENLKLLESAKKLFGLFIRFAQVPVKKGIKRVSLNKDLDGAELFEPIDSLVIPVRSNLEIKLPTTTHLKKPLNAFPKNASTSFNGADDLVNVFNSLQTPKQLTIRGSDGRPYRLMVKKDDTRKDAKVVEFTTLINRLLLLNNESRKRNLIISNYSVVPLAQNMGIIEFVNNVVTMKNVVNQERKKVGVKVNDRAVFSKLDQAQKLTLNSNDPNKLKLLKTFEEILLANPPVLHKWFLNQFSDPISWYLARNSYVRSIGVMSIVGYIIGLGDRHCENLLFFKETGSILHIDFDCLFEKGATLPTPEIVPFRLTQNVIDGMGINGVEGVFRKSCEVTGTILRDNEPSLMNILETLIYDPLLDWENQQNPESHLRKVRRKLRGLLDEEGLPMNIHGQIDLLIQQAGGNSNLSRMYGGWAPHI